MPPTEAEPVLVLRIDAKACVVEVDGHGHKVPLAGKLFEGRSHEKRPLAVGDLVQLDPSGQAIAAVLPRRSQLHRAAASEGEQRSQVLAANVTLVLVVASVAEPPFQPELVDGVLAAAAREELPAVLVLSKCDLDPAAAAHWQQVYAGAGVRVLATSTAAGQRTDATLAEVAALLHGNRTVLCGLSGAGKSTLVNQVVPGALLRTGELNHIGQGRHTTSHTELLRLPGGGHVLDTPGVRNFHLFCVGTQELQFLFPELLAQRAGCAYRGCLHDTERDCAVQQAAAAGTVPHSRYASYRAMLARAREAEAPPGRGGNAPKRGGGRRRPGR